MAPNLTAAAALLLVVSSLCHVTESSLYGLRQRKIVITNESPYPVPVGCYSEHDDAIYKSESIAPHQQFILKFKRDLFESPEYDCWTHLGVFKAFSRFYDCNRKESLYTCHWRIKGNYVDHYVGSTRSWEHLTPDQLLELSPTESEHLLYDISPTLSPAESEQ